MKSAARRKPAAQAVAAAPSIHLFHGHSGARVQLHADGAASFVRKTAAAPAANSRLIAQAEKQQRLQMLGLPFPRVLAIGQDESGCARFDMAYLPGRSLADAVIDAASFDTAAVVRTVERMMWLFQPCAGAALPAQRFRDKIAAIADGTGAVSLRVAALRLLACDWDDIPESPCHGDLTLENILLTADKKIGLIDCDEAFASSWWLDFGKLFQDIAGHWCLRRLYLPGAPKLRRVNAIQKLETLGAHFRKLAAACDPALPARLDQLAALGLLRAAPYAKSPQTIAFIAARIDHLLDGAA